MYPVIWRVPWLNWDVPGYGLMLMVGFLLTVVWAARRALKSQANPDVVLNLAFIALLAGVGGARFMHVVHNWREFSFHRNWLDLLFAVIDVRQGGLEVYGGVIAAIIGALIYLKLARHSIRWYLDIVAPSTLLGMGLGRLGCLLNGCCWGTVCDLPWAVRFPFGSNAMAEQWYAAEPGMELPQELISVASNEVGADGRSAMPLPRDLLWAKAADVEQARVLLERQADLKRRFEQAKTDAERQQLGRQAATLGGCNPVAAAGYVKILEAMNRYHLSLEQLQALARRHPSLPVHPTQLYSTIMLTLLALLLSAVYWRRTRDGQVICTMLLVEPPTRYVLELLRADNPVDTLGFTISQFLALSLSIVGLVGFFALRYLPARSPLAVPWVPPEEPAPGGKTARGRK